MPISHLFGKCVVFNNAGLYGYTGSGSCKSVESLTDYLINNYTDKSKGLFDNLQSVNSALGRLSVYPKNIVDTSKPDPNRPYPLLATSPYPELSLNEHYSMWQSADEMMFLEYLHPMVLSSVGVPGVWRM